ncbi:hypothetical protein [Streptomyces sp. LaBMicrA B280]|uniref:hypothetical protein n=1 Tax=Streptomyces sp. LaBMicrA B280 TaxID=3391001 RepID=UPI003BA486E5
MARAVAVRTRATATSVTSRHTSSRTTPVRSTIQAMRAVRPSIEGSRPLASTGVAETPRRGEKQDGAGNYPSALD